ncbi:MAG: enoyl-CoA hydratase [Myxococcota bacterium]|nr:enoyl-CoA hydratase [Myxococcota bacterium]
MRSQLANVPGVARLTLNRPVQFNALSEELLEHLQRALDELAEDASVHVVVLDAAGRAFCAGHDLREMRAHEDVGFHRDLFARCSRVMQTLQQIPQPVIGQVGGVATAAGCQLVASCDLAVAADTARFATSGINLGLFCATPSVAVSRTLLPKHAFELLLTGDFLDAETARGVGLVNHVVPADELAARVEALAATIAAKSPVAVRTGKRMFYRQLALPLSEAYAYAGEVMATNMQAEDAREGIDAFLEKRDPSWKGR